MPKGDVAAPRWGCGQPLADPGMEDRMLALDATLRLSERAVADAERYGSDVHIGPDTATGP